MNGGVNLLYKIKNTKNWGGGGGGGQGGCERRSEAFL